MPHLDIVDNRIYITSELSEREMIKLVPGSNWDGNRGQWHVPLAWASCVTLRGVFGMSLTMSQQVADWATYQRQKWIDPSLSLKPALEAPELMVSEPRLFPFQRVGVRFLETVGQALIADDMGSGKTIQIIRTIARLDAVPALIVCPNSMKQTWADEFAEWASGYEVSVVKGTAAQRKKAVQKEADIYIVNWESLRLHTNVAGYGSIALSEAEKKPKEMNGIKWATVVADEGHRAKDPNSKQTRALWAVSRDAQYRFAATGTPIESHPGELWSILHFISPEDFPRKTKYLDRYCHQVFNPFGGMEIDGLRHDTLGEFHAIVDPRVIRRPKDVILPQLPEKLENVRRIPMTGKQEKAYKQMADGMIAELNGGIIAALNPLQQFIRLSQFASAYAEVQDDKVVLSSPSNKVEAFLELLAEAGTEPIVAFAESKQLINLLDHELERKGISKVRVTGDETTDQRAAAVRDFQEGRARVILCTSAGAEGITLTAARILVFLQRFWSSIKNQQASDRIHRIGQERGVEIITFATEGTVDEYREDVLAEKNIALQEILQDAQVRQEMLTWGKKSRG